MAKNKSGFEIVNVKEFTNKLAKFNKFTSKGVKDRLRERGLMIEAEARENAPVAPVDGGTLKAGYHVNDTNINDFEISVETEVFYAPFVELGTSKMNAQPHLEPALINNKKGFFAAIEKTVKDEWKKP